MPHDKVQTPGMLPDTLVESLRQQIHDLPVKKKYFPKPKASEAEVGDHEGKKGKEEERQRQKKEEKKGKRIRMNVSIKLLSLKVTRLLNG